MDITDKILKWHRIPDVIVDSNGIIRWDKRAKEPPKENEVEMTETMIKCHEVKRFEILCIRGASPIGIVFIAIIIGHSIVTERKISNKWNVQQETTDL